MIKNVSTATVLGLLLVTMALFWPAPAQAQWPPFDFDIESIYKDGQITYNIRFSKEVAWPMADVIFKIPLPEGTRFIEAGAPSTTGTDFDGAEVTFFTPTLHRTLRDVYFVVEVIDPAKLEYTTRAWIAWKGEQPGDYLTRNATIDISRTPLEWQRPRSRLRLDAIAEVTGEVVTYSFYPVNIGGRRMWDLTITMPLPPGAALLSTEAPAPFAAGFDGQQAIFSILEMERRTTIGPLQVKISTAGVTEPLLITQAWATWTNVGRNVEVHGSTKTGDIIVTPNAARQVVVVDNADDTPFANYDLTSMALADENGALKVTYYTAQPMGPVGAPLEHYTYIDSDCNAETGKSRGNRGAEYWLRYRHHSGRAYVYTWDPVESTWVNRQRVRASTTGGRSATAWIPYSSIGNSQQVCWLTVARNRTKEYHPTPPVDWLGRNPTLTHYVTAAPPPAE